MNSFGATLTLRSDKTSLAYGFANNFVILATMKQSLKRFALIGVLYLVVFEVIEQFGVTRSENWEELAQMSLFAFTAGGLVWAVMTPVDWRRFRFLRRTGLLLGYAGTIVLVGNIYSWHVRPNVGLYREPLWVAQYPGFQKALQARIENNRW